MTRDSGAWRNWISFCLVLLTRLPSHGAATELLQAELTSVATQPRAGAPMWVEVRLTSKSPHVREGVLEFNHRVMGVTQWTYSTQELALAGGTQTFRFMLPPSQSGETEDRSLRLRFVEKEASADFGVFPITSQYRPGWPLTLAMGPTSARGAGEQRPLWHSFRLERFTPTDVQGRTAIFLTGVAVLDPADFPRDPAGYCAFDAILLEGADFARLKEKAVVALGQWLTAGGGLLVTGDGIFDDSHSEALRSWVESDPAAARVQFDSDGKLAEPADGGFSFARTGFGHFVLAPGRPKSDNDYDEESWRRAAAWVWKLRSEQVEAIVASGSLNYTPTKQAYSNERDHRLADGMNKLAQSLLPKTVRVMPRHVLVFLLAGFLFLIGPFDWWLLGRFRARRFTWLLLPAVTAVVTVTTMKLARYYLGEDSHRGSLVITDLAPNGSVARETRLDVLLPARRGTLSLNLTGSLCIPFYYSGPTSENFTPGFAVIGNFPQRFAMTRPLEQWSPIVTRQLRLGGGEDRSGIKWKAFRRELLAKKQPAEVARLIAGDSGCSVSFADESGGATLGSELINGDLMDAFTHTPQTGRAAFFSNLSPSGSAGLDDLACIERQQERSTLVIAAKKEGAALHLWRRLYLE